MTSTGITPSGGSSHQPSSEDQEAMKKWGTQEMGSPANPASHPDNQMAATWRADDHQRLFYTQQQQQSPYVVYSPTERPPSNPFESVANVLNTWSRRAEDVSRNIWHNLRTGPSVSDAVCGKIGVTAKAISEGGFESLFKQLFQTEPNERLKDTFACYLSTTTGPVAGTLYVSTHKIGFCSDRPLSFTDPSGHQAWSYYKVAIPLGRISTVDPVSLRERPMEKYVHLVTIDEHEFWFMGFISYEKACHYLLDSVSQFRAAESGGGGSVQTQHSIPRQ